MTEDTQADKVEYIYKKDGSYFADKRAAAGQAAYYEGQGVKTKLVEVEGKGWVLEVLSRRRPGRVPLAERSVLTTRHHDPNFVPRFVKAKPGRLEAFMDAGWQVVHGDETPGDTRVGGTTLPGSAITAPGKDGIPMVLMQKPRDWFEEDEADKHERNNQSEQALIRQAAQDNLHAVGGARAGIQIVRTGTRPTR